MKHSVISLLSLLQIFIIVSSQPAGFEDVIDGIDKEIMGTLTKMENTGMSLVTKSKDKMNKLDIGMLETLNKNIDDKYNQMKTLMEGMGKMKGSLKTKPKDFEDLFEVMKKEMESGQTDMPIKIIGMMKSTIGDKFKKNDMEDFIIACSGMLNKMNNKDMALKLTTGATAMMMMMTALDNIKSVDVPKMKNMTDIVDYMKNNGFSATIESMTKMATNLMADYATLQAMNNLNSVTAAA